MLELQHVWESIKKLFKLDDHCSRDLWDCLPSWWDGLFPFSLFLAWILKCLMLWLPLYLKLQNISGLPEKKVIGENRTCFSHQLVRYPSPLRLCRVTSTLWDSGRHKQSPHDKFFLPLPLSHPSDAFIPASFSQWPNYPHLIARNVPTSSSLCTHQLLFWVSSSNTSK